MALIKPVNNFSTSYRCWRTAETHERRENETVAFWKELGFVIEQLRAVAETEEEGAWEWVDVVLHMLDMSAHVICTVDLNLTVIIRFIFNWNFDYFCLLWWDFLSALYTIHQPSIALAPRNVSTVHYFYDLLRLNYNFPFYIFQNS